MTSCTYRFIPSSLIDLPSQRSYELKMRQQPQWAKMSVINERDRRPIEPPPILQVHWLHCSPDDTKKNAQCPFYFMVANLMSADSDELLSTQDYLAGSTVSSLYRLRDIDDTDGGFFVFGDLFCKKQGHYRLQFNLFEILEGHVQNRQVITSEPFRTYMPKRYPGPVEATFLSRAFSEQGVKMRIRKEHRISSGTARKRRLDVQALMDSQQESTPCKTTKISLVIPQRPIASKEPPRIAPAVTHNLLHQHQPQSMVNEERYNLQYHVPETMYYYQHHRQQQHHHHHPEIFAKPVTSAGTHHLSTKDQTTTTTTTASHAYPSPPLLPTRDSSLSSSSLMDKFPATLLDEYHLKFQQQQQQPCPSSSSASSLSPTTSSFAHHPSSVSPHSVPLQFYHDSHNHHSYGNNHPTTPPSTCIYPSDSHSPYLQHHVWGESLPALKAVMSGYTSRSIPLVLPCPFENE